MTELYWITRLNGIITVTGILLALALIVAASAAFALFVYREDYDYNEPQSAFQRIKGRILEYRMKWICVVLFCLAIITFVPTQKEALLIYGIGGTIDYIKSNDKAKQLPDKCIDALIRYVDSIEKENKDNNNN